MGFPAHSQSTMKMLSRADRLESPRHSRSVSVAADDRSSPASSLSVEPDRLRELFGFLVRYLNFKHQTK